MIRHHRDFRNTPTHELRDFIFKISQELNYRKLRDREAKLAPKIHSFPPIDIPTNYTIAEYNEIAFNYNSDNLMALPLNYDLSDRVLHLPSLMRQDWSFLYSKDEHKTEKKFYVYAHINPKGRAFMDGGFGFFGGAPFYIGKGTARRSHCFKRNAEHSEYLNQLMWSGCKKEELVTVLYKDLTEAKALELEAKLVYFFGARYDNTRINTSLVNIDLPIIPKYANGAMHDYITEQVMEDCKKKLVKKPRKTKK